MVVGAMVALVVVIMLALIAMAMFMGMLVLMRMDMTPGRTMRVWMSMLVRMFVSAFHRIPPGLTAIRVTPIVS